MHNLRRLTFWLDTKNTKYIRNGFSWRCFRVVPPGISPPRSNDRDVETLDPCDSQSRKVLSMTTPAAAETGAMKTLVGSLKYFTPQKNRKPVSGVLRVDVLQE